MKNLLTLILGLTASVHLIAQTTVNLDKMITIKPIFVANGAGYTSVLSNSSYAADFATFQAATQRVFAQANIRIVWEASASFASAANYTSTGTSFAVSQLVAAAGAANVKSSNLNAINLYFTGVSGSLLGASEQSLWDSGGFASPQGVNAMVTESIFIPGGTYSLTTIAHEIGHVLGLDHNAISAGSPYLTNTPLTGGNLMAQGVGATTFTGITSDGTSGFGILTANQVSFLRLFEPVRPNSTVGDTYTYSNSAIPEPADFALVASAVAGLVVIGRRRSRSAVAGK